MSDCTGPLPGHGNGGRPRKRPPINAELYARYEPVLKEDPCVIFAFSDSESFWRNTDRVKIYTKTLSNHVYYTVGIRRIDSKHGTKTIHSQTYKSIEEAEQAALNFRVELDFGKKFFQRKDVAISSSVHMTSLCSVIALSIDPEVEEHSKRLLERLRDGFIPPIVKFLSEPGEPAGIDCTLTLADLRNVHENFTMINASNFWKTTHKPSLFEREGRNKWVFRVFSRRHGPKETTFETEQHAIAGSLQFRLKCELSSRKIQTSPLMSIYGMVDALRKVIMDDLNDTHEKNDDLERLRQYRFPKNLPYCSADIPRPEESDNVASTITEQASNTEDVENGSLHHNLHARVLAMCSFAKRLNFDPTGTDENGNKVRLSRCGESNIQLHKRKEFDEIEKERILRIGVSYGIMDVRNSWSQKQQIAKVASTLVSYDSGFESKKEIDYKTYRRWEIKINEGIETSTSTCLETKHKGSKSTISKINDIDHRLMHEVYRKAEKMYLGRGTFSDLAKTMTHLFHVHDKAKVEPFLQTVVISKCQLRDWFIENNGQGVSDISRPLLTDELKVKRKEYCEQMLQQLDEDDKKFMVRIHTDEKWFYIRSGRQRVKRLPKAWFEDETVEAFYRRRERSRRNVEKVSTVFCVFLFNSNFYNSHL